MNIHVLKFDKVLFLFILKFSELVIGFRPLIRVPERRIDILHSEIINTPARSKSSSCVRTPADVRERAKRGDPFFKKIYIFIS